jgi:hypothetical protein
MTEVVIYEGSCLVAHSLEISKWTVDTTKNFENYRHRPTTTDLISTFGESSD